METLELELTPVPRAVAEARAAVTRRFAHLPPPALEDLRLLITELISNAILHSDLGPDDWVRVRVAGGSDGVRAEVIDGGVDADIRPKVFDPGSPGGFGLYLVDEISDRWGIERDGSTCVWFELSPVVAV